MSQTSNAPAKPRLLIIDDDVELCQLLAQFLSAEGLEVFACHSGEQGLQRLGAHHYDLIMLDVMLPGMNGFDTLRRLRAESSVPVLMLTAKGEAVDRIVGLELGADDYLAKPFNTRELLARVHAILRRVQRGSPGMGGAELLVIDDVELNAGARTVRCAGTLTDLTGVEFDLLHALLKQAGRVILREDLFKEVLGRRPMPEDRSLDMHVSNLRKKLGPRAGQTERIKTVRGQGYVYTRLDQASTDT